MSNQAEVITVELLSPEEDEVVGKIDEALIRIGNMWIGQVLVGLIPVLAAEIALIVFGQSIRAVVSSWEVLGLMIVVGTAAIMLARVLYFNSRYTESAAELAQLARDPLLTRTAIMKLEKIGAAAEALARPSSIYRGLKHPDFAARKHARQFFPRTA